MSEARKIGFGAVFTCQPPRVGLLKRRAKAARLTESGGQDPVRNAGGIAPMRGGIWNDCGVL